MGTPGKGKAPLAKGETVVNFQDRNGTLAPATTDSARRPSVSRFDSIAHGKLSDVAQTFREKLIQTHQSLKKMGLMHIVYLVGLICYTLGGALVFYLIDYDRSVVRSDLWKDRCLDVVNQSIGAVEQECLGKADRSGCLDLVRKALLLVDTCHKVDHTHPPSRPMTYSNAIVYAGSVYTTIGYGLVYPTTDACKVATFVYTILGIPYFLAVLQAFGRWLQSSFERLWTCCWRRYRTFLRSSSTSAMNKLKPQKLRHSRWIPLLIGFCATMAYLSLVGYAFQRMAYKDGFNFLDCFHFVLQSVALVGFGDIYPSVDNTVTYLLPSLLFGSFLMSMCFFILQDALMEEAYAATERVSASVKVIRRKMSQIQNSSLIYGLHSRARSLSPIRDQHGFRRNRAGTFDLTTGAGDSPMPEDRYQHTNTVIWKWKFLAAEALRQQRRSANGQAGFQESQSCLVPNSVSKTGSELSEEVPERDPPTFTSETTETTASLGDQEEDKSSRGGLDDTDGTVFV